MNGRAPLNVLVTGGAGFIGSNFCDRLVQKGHRVVCMDKLTTGRIEIDVIEFKGIEFRAVDNRLISLKLVQLGLSGAAMFGANGEVLQPSEVLYKKAVLVERGSFRPPTHVNFDMLQCALEKFKADPAVEGKEVLPLFELTMRNLLAGGDDIDRRDFLARFNQDQVAHDEVFAGDRRELAVADDLDRHFIVDGV